MIVSAALHPDMQGVPWHKEFQRYRATLDGAPAGGSMRIHDGIAQLTGASTAPGFRRRAMPAPPEYRERIGRCYHTT